MTFAQIVTKVCDYCTLTSSEAQARVGRSINAHYRRVTAALGMDTTRFVTRSDETSDGVRQMTFTGIEKIDRIIDVTGDVRPLTEVEIHEIRSMNPVDGEPSRWAVQNTGPDSVTVVFDTIPDAAYSLQADGTSSIADLAASDEPAFAESFHDILAWSVIAEELLKKEKDKLATKYEQKADRLLSELIFHYADSPTKITRQGERPSASSAATGGSGGSAESLNFLQAGSGAVLRTMQAKMRERVSVLDFGASGGGVADDSAAFALAIAALGTSGELFVPAGTYRINSTVALTNMTGLRIVGDGTDSIIKWGGGAAGPIFSVTGSHQCEIADLYLTVVSSSFPCASMIIQEENSGGEHSSMNRYRRLLMDGLGGYTTQCIYLKGDVTDQNNDFTTFDHCQFAGYTTAGVVLQGANCLENYFHNCQFSGQDTGDYGIKSITGAGGQAAHFCVYGGAALSHTEADFYLQSRAALPIVLDNTWGEGSERLFDGGIGSGAQCPITFRNCFWASDDTAVTDHFIRLGFPGPITIEGCSFGTDYTKAIKILWNYSPGFFAPSFTVRNTRILGSLTTVAGIFITNIPTEIQHTFAQTGDTAFTRLYRNTIPNNFALTGRNAADDADLNLLKVTTGNVIQLGVTSGDTELALQSSEFISVNKGIRFPAVQVSSSDANTLDDYEEGSWTPTITGSTSASGQVYTTQVGRYIKIGKLVEVQGKIVLSTLGTITGNVLIGGLPFTADAVTGLNGGAVVHFFTALTTSVTYVTGSIVDSSTSITLLYTAAAATGMSNFVQADLSNTTELRFTAIYRATA